MVAVNDFSPDEADEPSPDDVCLKMIVADLRVMQADLVEMCQSATGQRRSSIEDALLSIVDAEGDLLPLVEDDD